MTRKVGLALTAALAALLLVIQESLSDASPSGA